MEVRNKKLFVNILFHQSCQVRQSLHNNAGEGLFAKTLFASGDLVSILNGNNNCFHMDYFN